MKPYKPDLTFREYEIYMGYYCGVCKYIGKNYGQLPRMSLSYDAAFLAMLLASADETPDQPTREHCIMHPARKKTIIRNAAIEYAGDVMLILAWHKLLDDVHDEGKVYAKATIKLLHGIYKKLRRRHPALCKGIADNLSKLSDLEKARCDSIDQVAEPFSRIMEVIFYEGSRAIYGNGGSDGDDSDNYYSVDEFEDLHQIFANIGYHMGKWIYLIDAVDDIQENLNTGSYNPLFYRFSPQLTESSQRVKAQGHSAEEDTAADFRQQIRQDLEFNLFQYLAVLAEQISTLDIQKNSSIIENIIYFGLNHKTEDILNGKSDEGQKGLLRRRT